MNIPKAKQPQITTVNGIDYINVASFHYYSENKLSQGRLAGNANINGIEFKADDIVYFTYEGNLLQASVSRPTSVNGIEFTHNIEFYANGQVEKACFPNDVGTVNGIEFITNGLTESYIEFHENGNVKYGEIAKSTTINGVVYQAFSRLTFDVNGNVIDVFTDEEQHQSIIDSIAKDVLLDC